MRKPWLDGYLGDNPYCLLVVEQDGIGTGFAGAGPYRTDPGFQHTIETSLYLEPSATGRGLGSLLYQALFRQISSEDFHVALAGIALPNEPSLEATHSPARVDLIDQTHHDRRCRTPRSQGVAHG